jgi:hypothetical protein
MMIEVFKTNVEEFAQARKIIDLLLEHFPGHKINFDLHDCDKILRIEGNNFVPEKVRVIVIDTGFRCDVLE